MVRFRRRVLDYYRKHGRTFPWRPPSLKLRKDGSCDPYRILVSEIMLQQTQTDRVVAYYGRFLKQFPTVAALARAPLRDVLRVWQGLGYNRRALMLKRLAEAVVEKHRGRLPKTEAELRALPGIGPYTAAAVCAFAYNYPTVFIETNIRTVFLHHFFPRQRAVSDTELTPFVAATVDQKNPREWYAALMDYGAFLKKQYPNPSRRSAHHARQTKFEGSDRQIRGAIIRILTGAPGLSMAVLARTVTAKPARVEEMVRALKAEGFIAQRNGKYSIV